MITYPIIIMIDQQNFTGRIPAGGRGQKLFFGWLFPQRAPEVGGGTLL